MSKLLDRIQNTEPNYQNVQKTFGQQPRTVKCKHISTQNQKYQKEPKGPGFPQEIDDKIP